MSRAIWGLWVFLAVLASAVYSDTSFAATDEAAPVAAQTDPVDDREASFLPPPSTLLKVEDPKPSVAPSKASSADLTTPPPFTPKPEKAAPPPVAAPSPVASPAVAPVAQTAVAPQPAPSVESVVEKVKTAPPAPVAAQPIAPASPSVAAAPTDAAGASAPVPAKAPTPAAALGEPVSQVALAEVDPETLGLLSASNGGVGTTLWKDTDRLTVDKLLPFVILPTPSAALNDLARRAFLSTAAAPLANSKEKPVRSLLSQRIEALMALGAVTEAWKLASLADPKLVDEVTLRRLTEAALIGPESKEICDKVPSLIAAHAKTEESGSEWQKSLLVCQLRAGDMKAVQLGIDLMREQNAKDAIFLALINKNVLATSSQLPRQLTPLRPMTLAVLRHTGLPLPPELFARAEPLLVPELLRAKSSDESARVAMAEKFAARGLLTAEQLSGVYKEVSFTPEQIAKATSQTDPTPTSRAMAYQALLNEQAPQKKIDLIQKIAAGLSPVSLISAHGALIAAALDNVPVIADYNAFAVPVARYFTLAGKPDKALVWLKLAQSAGAQSETIRAALSEQWPLFVLSGLIADGDYAQGLKTWLDVTLTVEDAQDGNAIHARRAYAGTVLLLLNAMGYAVAEEAWQRVVEPQPPSKQLMPSALLLERMTQAAAAGRRGEAILLALLVEGGSDATSPFAVRLEVLRALRQAGLTTESQAYAREIFVGLSK